jgi:hypothetical protein
MPVTVAESCAVEPRVNGDVNFSVVEIASVPLFTVSDSQPLSLAL